MDSVDRGYQTAEFGGDKSLGSHNSSGLGLDKEGQSYKTLIEDLSQTFTTMRDFKRKEALETLSELLLKARFTCSSTKAAYEAV